MDYYSFTLVNNSHREKEEVRNLTKKLPALFSYFLFFRGLKRDERLFFTSVTILRVEWKHQQTYEK